MSANVTDRGTLVVTGGSRGTAAAVARLAGRIPMGRAGTAEEAVIWLLSPAASYVTGSILTVSGGR